MSRAPAEDDAVTEASAPRIRTPTSAFVLTVVGGDHAGRRIALVPGAPRALVGQSTVCDLRLEDRRVSRRHLALDAAADHVRVTDLGSTNGTFLGATRIVEALLAGGEQIRIGDTVLEVSRAFVGETSPATTSRETRYGGLLGASAAMRALHPIFDRLARAAVPVLIEGETGTGKEVLAEALHDASPRAGKPFVVFDCTAVAPSLVESELFGHERGAFTGASGTHAGLFEQAHGGTLLIDEIGDLDATLQPKLLRALERSEIRRVGGQRVIQVDVRILSATRRDLDREVQEGRFRDDLFHRLAVTRIELPPLRQRRGDITLLAQHFAASLGGDAIPYDQIVRWEAHAWPGNVRELRNAVARYLTLGDLVPPSSRTPERRAGTFDGYFGVPIGIARQRLIAEFERAYVAHVLAQHGGNVDRASAASGIARRQFFRLKARATTE